MEDVIIKNMDLNYTPPEEIQVEMDIEEKVKVLNQDSTIAIIGKTVASEEELNFIYHKYSLLPKMFKRISNQYSTQLFGYNVPNMYAIMRSKFVDNDFIFRDQDHPMDESYIEESISLNNIKYYQDDIKRKYPDKVLDKTTLKKLSTLLNNRLKNALKNLYTILKTDPNHNFNNLKVDLFDLENPSLNTFLNQSSINYIYIKYNNPEDKDSIYSDIEVYRLEINIINPYLKYDDVLNKGITYTDEFVLNNNNILFRWDYKTKELFSESVTKNLEDINAAVINKDIATLESLDLSNVSIQDKAMLDYEINEAKNEILENSVYNFSDFTMVPWFTPSEEYYKLEYFEDPDYARKVIHAMNVYGMNPTLENCSKVLDLGWNPEVKVTKESVEYAKKRQSEWLNENRAIIYDISNRDIPLNESSKMMRDFYKENNIYPIYIVLSWNNTLFGKLIKFVKNSKFTHAGLSLDSDLREIVTFKYGSNSNGFEIENLKRYINTYNDCQIEVLCLFVDEKIQENIKKSIKYYRDNKDKTKYSFKNLFNILLNKKKDFTEYDVSMVCSQFVDQILKLNDINITNKANNLVIPQDYVSIANKNPRVYKIFEGYGKDYYDGRAEANIKNLIESRTRNTVIYRNESAADVNEYIDIPLELAIYSIEKQ